MPRLHEDSTPPGRATLRDVARLSGVSPKTAARAINGEANVRAETREKVLTAAASLRFRPNRMARELRQGAQSSAVGLVVGGLENPFYSNVAAGLAHALRGHGLELIIATTADDPEHERAVVQTMLERRVRALIMLPASTEHAYLDGERQQGTSIVFVDRPSPAVATDTVLIDNRGGVRQALRSLLAHGHQRIAAVADIQDLYTARERVLAFSEMMEDVRTSGVTGLVRTGVHDVQAAYEATLDLLRGPSPPTAILSLNNRISLGTLKAMYELRSQNALIGFDDFDLADVLGVSVVAYDSAELGRRAAEIALSRMALGPGTPKRIIIPTELVLRGSGERPPVTTLEDHESNPYGARPAGRRESRSGSPALSGCYPESLSLGLSGWGTARTTSNRPLAKEIAMTTTPDQPLRDEDMETTGVSGGVSGIDADGTDADGTDANGTDGDATDTVDGDASDADGTDSNATDG